MKRTCHSTLRGITLALAVFWVVLSGVNVKAAQSLAQDILNSAVLPEGLIPISESLPSDSETQPLKDALAAMSEMISITDQLQTLERFC